MLPKSAKYFFILIPIILFSFFIFLKNKSQSNQIYVMEAGTTASTQTTENCPIDSPVITQVRVEDSADKIVFKVDVVNFDPTKDCIYIDIVNKCLPADSYVNGIVTILIPTGIFSSNIAGTNQGSLGFSIKELSSFELPTSYTCNGNVLMDGNLPVDTCPYGCNSAYGECNPKPVCNANDSVHCSANGYYSQSCQNGVWVYLKACPNGCENGQCLEEKIVAVTQAEIPYADLGCNCTQTGNDWYWQGDGCSPEMKTTQCSQPANGQSYGFFDEWANINCKQGQLIMYHGNSVSDGSPVCVDPDDVDTINQQRETYGKIAIAGAACGLIGPSCIQAAFKTYRVANAVISTYSAGSQVVAFAQDEDKTVEDYARLGVSVVNAGSSIAGAARIIPGVDYSLSTELLLSGGDLTASAVSAGLTYSDTNSTTTDRTMSLVDVGLSTAGFAVDAKNLGKWELFKKYGNQELLPVAKLYMEGRFAEAALVAEKIANSTIMYGKGGASWMFSGISYQELEGHRVGGYNIDANRIVLDRKILENPSMNATILTHEVSHQIDFSYDYWPYDVVTEEMKSSMNIERPDYDGEGGTYDLWLANKDSIHYTRESSFRMNSEFKAYLTEWAMGGRSLPDAIKWFEYSVATSDNQYHSLSDYLNKTYNYSHYFDSNNVLNRLRYYNMMFKEVINP